MLPYQHQQLHQCCHIWQHVYQVLDDIYSKIVEPLNADVYIVSSDEIWVRLLCLLRLNTAFAPKRDLSYISAWGQAIPWNTWIWQYSHATVRHSSHQPQKCITLCACTKRAQLSPESSSCALSAIMRRTVVVTHRALEECFCWFL